MDRLRSNCARRCAVTPASHTLKTWVKVKGQGQKDGVPHNFLIYEQIALKLHQKVCSETS